MATAQEAPKLRVARAERVGGGARLLQLERADGGELGFVGGQYAIINTGIVLPGGKLAKRAYSFLSSDADQRRVEIAVKRIEGGPGSGFLHEVDVGAELPFSGPWGKLKLTPERGGRALVVATDTAITAGLGIACGAEARGRAEAPELLWLVESFDDFLPERFVRERAANATIVADFLPVGHPERAARACALVEAHLAARRFDVVLCAGDGAVIYPLRDRLIALGVPEAAIGLESFFNNPLKATAKAEPRPAPTAS